MPGKHNNPTISFRPSSWERALIEERADTSGMYKKDFITRSCIFSNIVVVGKRGHVQHIFLIRSWTWIADIGKRYWNWRNIGIY